MKISTKGVYAMEAIVDLAMHSDGELVTIKDIVARTGISEKYLERIVGELKKGHLLDSTRGKFGGYRLSRPASQITVSQILYAVEGDLAPVECLRSETDCGIDCNRCATRSFWSGLWECMKDVVESVTLEQIVEEVQQISIKGDEPLEYYI